MKLCWEATGSRVMCEGSSYRTGIGGSESSTCNDFKQVSVAAPRRSIISLTGFKQSTPQDVR